MRYQIPSLNGLRAFEVAARHLSFKEAARELFVTPGAVSQQIKVLEGHLGTSLFRRGNRTIEMTEAGRALLPVLREAFQNISDAIERLSGQGAARPLTASVLPSFAIKWLVPRLGRFRERHPEFDVRISTATQLVDFAREEVDLAIRYGLGTWPGVRCDRLMTGELFTVCSPKLLKGDHPIREPADLRHHTLLHNDSRREWPLWLRVHGVPGIDVARGPSFSDDGLVLQAAIEGQGVALARTVLVEEDLRRGRLRRPFKLSVPSDLAYYIVVPEGRPDTPKIAAFREWLLEEAHRTPHEERP